MGQHDCVGAGSKSSVRALDVPPPAEQKLSNLGYQFCIYEIFESFT